MTWITQNKGAGPWPFQKQAEKCGYVNNPRWTGAKADANIHEPCGYWYKSLSHPAGYSLWATGFNADGELGIKRTLDQDGFTIDSVYFTWVMDGVKSISGGELNSYILKSDGSLWATGNNFYGQLAQGYDWGVLVDTDQFMRIGTRTDWVVASGIKHGILALASDGTIWGCGRNALGELGIGNTTPQFSLTQESSLSSRWRVLAAGDANFGAIALKDDGSLWGVGGNNKGQLGLGDLVDRYVWTRIGTDADWAKIANGPHHNLALKNNGTLWATGLNAEGGALGLGDYVDRNVLTQVGSATDWKLIFCGDRCSMAIKNDGTLWGAGYNIAPDDLGSNPEYGKIGLGALVKTNVFVQVGTDTDWSTLDQGQCGMHVTALKRSGSLWSSGSTDWGQLGLGGHTTGAALHPYVSTLTRVVKTIPDLPDQYNWVAVNNGPYHSMALRLGSGSSTGDRCGNHPVWPMPT